MSVRSRVGRAAAAVVLAATACTSPSSGRTAQPLAITHVTLIDVESGTRRPDHSVIVEGSRIIAVGPSDSTPVPHGARVIDARSKFLIPGLWDMHVHTPGADAVAMLPVYVAYGVTGVRDMGADLEQLQGWRNRIAEGTLVGPRIVMAGPILDGPLGVSMPAAHRRWRIEITDTARGRRVVDSLATAGADFIKVHQRLGLDIYHAIADQVHHRGLAFAGHVPSAVGPDSAVAVGQRSLEHLVNIPFRCTAAEADTLRPRFPLEALFGSCDTTDQAPLHRRFAASAVWLTPTLVVQQRVALGLDTGSDDPGLRHVPLGVRAMLRDVGPFDLTPHTPERRARLARLLEKRVHQVGTLHRAGARLMTGTDAPGVAPGWSLHEELALFVRAGLTPTEALRAATLAPARYLGATDSSGLIAPRKLADLVLLDADPLADVRATRRVWAVVADGRLVERAELERILREK